MKFKSASSNPRVTSSNHKITSSNPRVTSSILRVTSENPRVTSLNPRDTSSDPRIIKSMKTQVNSLKSSPFPKIISPKLFDSLWDNSVSGDDLFFYVSCTPWLWLHLEGEWVNINFDRIDQNSP